MNNGREHSCDSCDRHITLATNTLSSACSCNLRMAYFLARHAHLGDIQVPQHAGVAILERAFMFGRRQRAAQATRGGMFRGCSMVKLASNGGAVTVIMKRQVNRRWQMACALSACVVTQPRIYQTPACVA